MVPETPPVPPLTGGSPSVTRPYAFQPRVPLLVKQWNAVLVLGIIVLGGLILRGHHLAERCIWFDEAFSWKLIEFPFSEMLERIARDNHPPLYFVLLKGWAAVWGTSLLALRSLSVLLGGVSLVGAYLFTVEALWTADEPAARTARRRAIGLFVAAAVALNVFQIHWAREVRMYTLGTSLAAFSGWALFRALHSSPTAYRPWLLLGLLNLLFIYTHYYALFSFVAQSLFVGGLLLVQARGRLWAVWKDPRLGRAVLSAGVVVVGWLPWVPIFLKQHEQVREGFWIKPVSVWRVAEASCRMFLVPENVRFETPEAAVVVVFCAVVLLALLWRARAGAWYIFLAATVPLALSIVLSIWVTPLFVPRYFLFSQVFFLAGLGVVLGRISYPWLRRVLCSGFLIASFIACLYSWQALDLAHKPGDRAAAAFIDGQRLPGEPIVVSSPLLFVSILYHTADRGHWYVYTPGPEVLHYEGAAVLTPEELIDGERLRRLDGRVWVVNIEGGSWGDRKVPVPEGWTLRRQDRFVEPFTFQGETVVEEYQAVPGSAPE
jgi:hypothetical protein